MMKYIFFLLTIFFIGCSEPHPIFKAGPEVDVQMHNEAERLRTTLDGYFKTKDSPSQDGLYKKALENEIN